MTISGQELADVIYALPAWRQEVVMRYKFESGRRESALAFKLLQDILHEEGLLSEGEINNLRFDIGEHGKPVLRNHEDIHFNLSHCKNSVACVVADHPVGVDVECIGRCKDGLAKYTLSEEELHTLYYNTDGSKRDDDEIQTLFTVFWTKKEALLKLLGTGITDDVKHILHLHADDVEFRTTINAEKQYVVTVCRYR